LYHHHDWRSLAVSGARRAKRPTNVYVPGQVVKGAGNAIDRSIDYSLFGRHDRPTPTFIRRELLHVEPNTNRP
jgi:hypothetical protein